jgi:uncharacterized protein YndB with AHSA1/START domain
VRRTVTVKQPPPHAFALFTARIDQWWPHGAGVPAGGLAAAPGRVVLEPRPDGHIYWRRDDGTVETWGEVRVWEPPHRLVLAWHPAVGSPASTEVEIRLAPEGSGTRVELEHRGWDQLGEPAAATRAQYESGWGEVLGLYAAAGRDNGAAIASLILGITSIALPILGLVAAPFAIGFGIAGRRRAHRGARQGGLATAGLTLGAIGLVLWGLLLALGASVVVVNQVPDGRDEPVPVETTSALLATPSPRTSRTCPSCRAAAAPVVGADQPRRAGNAAVIRPLPFTLRVPHGTVLDRLPASARLPPCRRPDRRQRPRATQRGRARTVRWRSRH